MHCGGLGNSIARDGQQVDAIREHTARWSGVGRFLGITHVRLAIGVAACVSEEVIHFVM